MDYEQFYRYLDSRPAAEIRNCVQRVASLAKKHSIDVSFLSTPTDTSEPGTASQYHRLQASQQVWCQHAIWNKFGSSSVHHATLKDLKLATSDLFTEGKVAEFLLQVDTMIKQEVEPAPHYGSITSKSLYLPTSNRGAATTASGTANRPSRQNTSIETSRFCETFAPQSNQKLSESGDSDWEQSLDGEIDSSSDRDSDRSKSEVGLKRSRNEPYTKTFWTSEMDVALETAVASHKIKGWAAVAQHVGYSVTNTQCKNRWISYGKPLQDGLRSDSNWSKAEVSRLRNLVAKHIVKPYWSKYLKGMTRQYIDWQTIGKYMGRTPRNCCNKWELVGYDLEVD